MDKEIKKGFRNIILLMVFTISLGVGLSYLFDVVSAQNNPPQIFIYSPENTTYYVRNIFFNFTVIDDNSENISLWLYLNDNLLDNFTVSNNSEFSDTSGKFPPFNYTWNFTIVAEDMDLLPLSNSSEVLFTINDNVAPYYGNNNANTTLAPNNTVIVDYAIDWHDAFGLNGYIFSYTDCVLNNWIFINDSFINNSIYWTYGNESNTATAQKILNCTPNCTFKRIWYANDLNINWNKTNDMGMSLSCVATTTTTSTTTTISPITPSYSLDITGMMSSVCTDNTTLRYYGSLNNQSIEIIKVCEFGCDAERNLCNPEPFLSNIIVFAMVIIFIISFLAIGRLMRIW
jgi:hypothetical protein